MTKTFCDRCGRDITIDYARVTVYINRYGNDSLSKNDGTYVVTLCAEHRKELIELLTHA